MLGIAETMKANPFPPRHRLRQTAGVLSLLAAAAACRADTSLTIYNQNFAVVRESITLDLRAGSNAVSFDRATLHVEPDSVVLRDPAGKVSLRILEQSYRADTASQALMLSLFEGREVDFLQRDGAGGERIVRGRVIRSGYTPNFEAAGRYGNAFYQRQMGMGNPAQGGSPLIEVEGKLRFSLPGEPLFPARSDDAILRPTLAWSIQSDREVKLDAELGYITGGMSWQSAYNLVSPEKGDTLDIVGWVTLDNQTGKVFEQARVKLMAGDVSKLEPEVAAPRLARMAMSGAVLMADEQVTQKAFDEFHLYALPRPVTLRNQETKQVEFLRASGVRAETFYVYNVAALQPHQRNWNDESVRNDRDYGTQSNPKVWVYREFPNTKENGLGIPLPKGRVRFYREDSADRSLEFTGENQLDHTPEGERVRLYTGDAFDIVGERRRTDYQLSRANDQMEEAFEIRVRNRKKEAVEVRVAERLYRWVNWTLLEQSEPHRRIDDRNIEFRVRLEPDEERVVTYRVRYDWK